MIGWLNSTRVGEVKSFLRLLGYYKSFVEEFSKIATPLTNLARKASTLNGMKTMRGTLRN